MKRLRTAAALLFQAAGAVLMILGDAIEGEQPRDY